MVSGSTFRYDVNASDSSGIDSTTWAVNNTADFTINNERVIPLQSLWGLEYTVSRYPSMIHLEILQPDRSM
ncbi:MAG: hypothetical protein P1Q69_19300 [Candidatus Thorarchaeota archaeon]|nr:hypothetical protein [Candidatus Thorarchaeota archaeon]